MVVVTATVVQGLLVAKIAHESVKKTWVSVKLTEKKGQVFDNHSIVWEYIPYFRL